MMTSETQKPSTSFLAVSSVMTEQTHQAKALRKFDEQVQTCNTIENCL